MMTASAPETRTDPLDNRWYVRVGNDIYGPYTGHQMRNYVREGRVMPNSQIAPEGAREWAIAAQDPILSVFFAAKVEPQPQLRPVALTATPAAGGVAEPEAHGELSNFVIVYPQGARSVTRLEQTIMNLGPACKLSPHIWIVSSRETSSAIRNKLTEFFGKSDCLLVVDASRGKAAWFNFGPEQEARIRRVWQRGDRNAV